MTLRVSVCDTGIGLSPDEIARIFEQLMALDNELNEEERRFVREGFDNDEQLAIFDLLRKENLKPAEIDRIRAAAGSGRRDLADRSVSQPLEKVMESRKPYLSDGDPEHVLLPCEGSLRPLLCAWPIIAAGDVTGAVGLLAEDRTQQPDPAQQKAVAVAAAFLAKQMEE